MPSTGVPPNNLIGDSVIADTAFLGDEAEAASNKLLFQRGLVPACLADVSPPALAGAAK